MKSLIKSIVIAGLVSAVLSGCASAEIKKYSAMAQDILANDKPAVVVKAEKPKEEVKHIKEDKPVEHRAVSKAVSTKKKASTPPSFKKSKKSKKSKNPPSFNKSQPVQEFHPSMMPLGNFNH